MEPRLKEYPDSCAGVGQRERPLLFTPLATFARIWASVALSDPCSPEAEEESEALKAIADRTGEVLRVTSPHCQFTNEYPHLDHAFIVRCRECWEAIAVEEMRQ